MTPPEPLLQKLSAVGQQHLLQFWDQLSSSERGVLAEQIERVDFAALRQMVAQDHGAPDWRSLAERAQGPRAVRLAGKNEFSADAALLRGETALRAGEVAMILVAGGQGTRLGFPNPKGLFPLGPVSGRTLFQILVDRLLAIGHRYGRSIPLHIMTSVATHEVTVDYFERNRRLGLAAADLRYFCQGMLPAVDKGTGRVLLESPGSLALSPDGHGGMLAALAAAGYLDDLRRRGIRWVFYGQVDNPLLQVCDPTLLGYHILADSEMTTQVVEKRFPLERVGNVVEVDGQARIIEYSDLPAEVAEQREPDGRLRLWAGNLAVHVFSTSFLCREASDAAALPIHLAVKKVPFVDVNGTVVNPTQPNAYKFERFIFDLLPQARNPMVVEVAAAEAFAPVKNAPGESVDTPATAQAAMMARDRRFLAAAGIESADQIAVEVNPLWAWSPAEAAAKLAPGTRLLTDTYFGAESR